MTDSLVKLIIRSVGLIVLIGVWICLIFSIYYAYKAGGRLTALLMQEKPLPLLDTLYIGERALQIKLLFWGGLFFIVFVFVKLITAYFSAGFSIGRGICFVLTLVSIAVIFWAFCAYSDSLFDRYYEAAKKDQQETQEAVPQLLPGLEKHNRKEAIASEREEKTMLIGLTSLLLGAAGVLFFKELESARNSVKERKNETYM